MKVFPKSCEHSLDYYNSEKIALEKLSNHKNIIKLIDSYETSTDYILILEYAPKRDLFDYIEFTGKFGEELAREILHQLIPAIEHIHSLNHAHLDLKMDNIFIGNQCQVKVADFDCARELPVSLKMVGTSDYMAPEILEGKAFDGKKVDVFALGVMMFILVCGYFPFNNAKASDLLYREIINKDSNKFWEKHVKASRAQLNLSNEIKELIEGMIAYDPKDRFDIEKIKSSKFYVNNGMGKTKYVEEMEAKLNVIVHSESTTSTVSG